MIITVNSNLDFYNILTKNKKVIIFYYVMWSKPSQKLLTTFIKASQLHKKNVVFSIVNIDLHSDIQILYDIDINKLPCVMFFYGTKIDKMFYGNNQPLFEDYLFDFIKLH
jgi:thioredoxin-like negative regulator of GroEL